MVSDDVRALAETSHKSGQDVKELATSTKMAAETSIRSEDCVASNRSTPGRPSQAPSRSARAKAKPLTGLEGSFPARASSYGDNFAKKYSGHRSTLRSYGLSFARSKLARISAMLRFIRSPTIASASSPDFFASSARSRVFSIVASNALRASSVCLARTSCGFPVGLKSRTCSSVSPRKAEFGNLDLFAHH